VLFNKILPYILFEKHVNFLALEMVSPGNQHCANCIGTLSFPIVRHQPRSPTDVAEVSMLSMGGDAASQNYRGHLFDWLSTAAGGVKACTERGWHRCFRPAGRLRPMAARAPARSMTSQ